MWGKSMILYHGSNKVVKYPGVRKTKYSQDFYFGFYGLTKEDLAIRWAARYGEKGYLNKYEYVQDENLDNLIFPGMTEEWLDFIVASRNGKGHRYDIVEGPMVDETIYNSIQNFIDGKISRMAFWELVKSQSPVRQISFHSVSALDTLTFMGSWKVKAFKNLFD